MNKPIYLHFEDWTAPLFVGQLDKKGYPHGDKIFKVIPSREDPRQLFDKPNLYVFESSGEPFTDEQFDMGDRGVFSGQNIEEELTRKNVTEAGKQLARALLRFSTRDDTQFTQGGMHLMVNGKYVIDHPLGDIDGLDKTGRDNDLHLDVFEEESLARLGNIIDINDPSRFVGWQEHLNSRRAEGQKRSSQEIL